MQQTDSLTADVLRCCRIDETAAPHLLFDKNDIRDY